MKEINEEVHLQILSLYKNKEIKYRIKSRLDYLTRIYIRGGTRLWAELVFCLLTPQSKARNACRAISELYQKDLLYSKDVAQISLVLKKHVRFHNNKSLYILEAGKNFDNICSLINHTDDKIELRNNLFKQIKGMGMKEASHFLRNIGFGHDVAILDRHILRVMDSLNILPENISIKDSLTLSRYLEIEASLRLYSKDTKIPLEYIDFVFWYKATNDIFK